MFEVEITNYESIAYAKIQVEGFTTLVGRNHLGKSAILRAINAALTNQQGTDFIKWGETFCEVRIKLPDFDILWHKEDGNHFYKIKRDKNDKWVTYNKIGKGDPPKEILDAGFKPVQAGDKKVNLNYAVQFSPLFLVDKIDSRGADLLTSVYGLDRLYRAIDLCNKEQRIVSDTLRLREKDLQLVERGLEKFKDFDNIVLAIPVIKNKKADIDLKEKEIETLRVRAVEFKTSYKECKRLKPALDIKLPEVSSILNQIDEYKKISTYSLEMKKVSDLLKKIKNVFNIKIPHDRITEIKNLYEEYQKLSKWSKSYYSIVKEIEKLEKANNIKLPNPLSGYDDLPGIKRLYIQIKNLKTEYMTAKNSYESINKDIFSIKEKISKFDVCPLCGQALKEPLK